MYTNTSVKSDAIRLCIYYKVYHINIYVYIYIIVTRNLMNTDMRTNKLGFTVSDFEAQIFF